MSIFSKINVTVVVMALMTIFLGLHIAYTGTVKGFAFLGNERYLIGGITILTGLYFLYLGLKTKKEQ